MSHSPTEGRSAVTNCPQKRLERVTKALWSAAGTFFLVIGMIGIAVPVLPTTPFLLLAAACYLRGSKRMYDWMMTNRIFGKYLRDYHEGRGISWRVKAGAIAFLWIVISITAIFFTDKLWLRLVLVAVATAVSAHIVMIHPKASNCPGNDTEVPRTPNEP